jgi:thiamine pyrophosphokinase
LLAVIFLDGDYEDAAYYRQLAQNADLLGAADGGARFLLEQRLRPQFLVGDFDSLAPGDVQRLRDMGVDVEAHPVRKDVTDGELAVAEGLRRGAGELVLAGALGALDHTLGHLAILRRLAARGVVARLAAPHLAIRVLVAPADAVLDSPTGTRVSIVPLGGDAEVTLDDLDYPLDHGMLPADACLGLGNSVVAPASARVVLHRGIVALLVENGAERFGAGPDRSRC